MTLPRLNSSICCLAAFGLAFACTNTEGELTDDEPSNGASNGAGNATSGSGDGDTTLGAGGTGTVMPGPTGGGTTPDLVPLPCGISTGELEMIDDFEDGDTLALVGDAREGNWFGSSDAGEYANLAGETDADRGAVFHIQTPELAGEWGGTAGLNFGGACYNAAPYAGVGFWARGTGTVAVEIRISETTPQNVGGHCEEDYGNPAEDCATSNFHSVRINLKDEWTYYDYAWGEFAQASGFGIQTALAHEQLEGVSFRTVGATEGYDLYLDDLTFLTEVSPAMGGAAGM